MKEISVASIAIRHMIQGAQQQGVDCRSLLLKHRISALAISNEQHRVPLKNYAAVALELMTILDDEMLGLANKPQPLGSFNLMCHACINAKNIKRSIKRAANYWNLFRNTYEHRVFISSGKIYYELHPLANQQALNNYVVESILSSLHRFHCWLTGQFIPLASVSMSFPEPEYSKEYHGLFYGAPMKFDQPYCQIEFDAQYAALEIVQTPDTLDQYLKGNNLSLLYQPRHYRAIGDQVKQWLGKNIKQGNYHATLKQAAEHFRVSQQVLHRRLQKENTSYKEIKMQIRRDIAINLLFSNQYKIEDIANKVGFSEPSAFIRAFKSWTGDTPLSYRQKNR